MASALDKYIFVSIIKVCKFKQLIKQLGNANGMTFYAPRMPVSLAIQAVFASRAEFRAEDLATGAVTSDLGAGP